MHNCKISPSEMIYSNCGPERVPYFKNVPQSYASPFSLICRHRKVSSRFRALSSSLFGTIKANSLWILICIFDSVQPKPLFWFRYNTETETQIGQYCLPIHTVKDHRHCISPLKYFGSVVICLGKVEKV